jgi:hypothetical protein
LDDVGTLGVPDHTDQEEDQRRADKEAGYLARHAPSTDDVDAMLPLVRLDV